MLFMVLKLSHGRKRSERASCLWLFNDDNIRDITPSHTRLTQKLGRWILSHFEYLIESVDTPRMSEWSKWRNELRGNCPEMMIWEVSYNLQLALSQSREWASHMAEGLRIRKLILKTWPWNQFSLRRQTKEFGTVQ